VHTQCVFLQPLLRRLPLANLADSARLPLADSARQAAGCTTTSHFRPGQLAPLQPRVLLWPAAPCWAAFSQQQAHSGPAAPHQLTPGQLGCHHLQQQQQQQACSIWAGPSQQQARCQVPVRPISATPADTWSARLSSPAAAAATAAAMQQVGRSLTTAGSLRPISATPADTWSARLSSPAAAVTQDPRSCRQTCRQASRVFKPHTAAVQNNYGNDMNAHCSAVTYPALPHHQSHHR
jgi:hypothetical protein